MVSNKTHDEALIQKARNSQAHAALTRAVAAVGMRLLEEVSSSLKRLLRLHWESQKELGQAPEWEELIRAVSDASDTYADIAISNQLKKKVEVFEWVKSQIEEDENSISLLHFGCDRDGYSAPKTEPKISLENDPKTWSAKDHLGLRNSNALWSAYCQTMERAVTVALNNAAIRIGSGRAIPVRSAKLAIPGTGDSSQSEVPRVAGLCSEFESRVGQLMLQARKQCQTKYLPLAAIFRIAALLDDEKLPVRANLERIAARLMAEYNQRHPNAAIKSWKAALGHPQFRHAVRKRFSRAEEKFKKVK
jgi:hypothetical protein